MRPRRNPPTPRATARESAPDRITWTGGREWSPRRMTEPVPQALSTCAGGRSNACSRSSPAAAAVALPVPALGLPAICCSPFVLDLRHLPWGRGGQLPRGRYGPGTTSTAAPTPGRSSVWRNRRPVEELPVVTGIQPRRTGVRGCATRRPGVLSKLTRAVELIAQCQPDPFHRLAGIDGLASGATAAR